MHNQKWTTANIPDQSGKIIAITGGTSGLGYRAAEALLAKNARVILAARNADKLRTAAAALSAAHPQAALDTMILDLAELNSVRQFSANFLQKYRRLDVLINNAGVMAAPYSRTRDGFEMQMGTNHFGHFALTALLIEALRATPGSRIVSVSSNAHLMGNPDFSDLTWERRTYKKWNAYGDSKIANLYFTYEYTRKNAGQRSTIALAAHPGWTATDLQRHSGLFSFLNFMAQDVSMGVLPILYAATVPGLSGGGYYGPDGWKGFRGYPVRVESNERSHNAAAAKQLWEISEQATKTPFTF